LGWSFQGLCSKFGMSFRLESWVMMVGPFGPNLGADPWGPPSGPQKFFQNFFYFFSENFWSEQSEVEGKWAKNLFLKKLMDLSFFGRSF
jgi:hypothetical protein